MAAHTQPRRRPQLRLRESEELPRRPVMLLSVRSSAAFAYWVLPRVVLYDGDRGDVGQVRSPDPAHPFVAGEAPVVVADVPVPFAYADGLGALVVRAAGGSASSADWVGLVAVEGFVADAAVTVWGGHVGTVTARARRKAPPVKAGPEGTSGVDQSGSPEQLYS